MFGGVRILGGHSRRGDEYPYAMLLALLDQAADSVQIDALMLGIRLRAPADVVDPVRDDKHGRPMREDVATEPREAAGGGVATPAGIDETDLSIGEPQQRVILDDLAVGSRRGDAVSEKYDGVAVSQRKLREGCTRGAKD